MRVLKSIGLRTFLGLLGACGCAMPAQAQIGPLTSPPTAPADLSPVSGTTFEGRTGGAIREYNENDNTSAKCKTR